MAPIKLEQSLYYVSKAAPTPVVDANRLYAFFESGDVIAVDHDGKAQCKRSLVKDFGQFAGNHGIGSSLAQTNDAVIVLVDHAGPCYLVALSKTTGQTLWKTDRTQRVGWSSPIVAGDADHPIIVTSSNGTVDAYDALTGQSRWSLTGFKGNTVPSPTVAGDRVYLGSREVDENMAVALNTARDTDDTSRALWRAADASSSFASPLAYDGNVYFVNRAGIAYCLSAATGETLWSTRLAAACWASPIAVDGRLYFFTQSGVTHVLKPGGAEPTEIARNELPTDDRVYGVAVANASLFVRTGRQLACIRSAPTVRPNK